MKVSRLLADRCRVNGDVAANYMPAGRVSVTKLDRKEIVISGIAIVGHIHREPGFFLAGADCSDDVGSVTGNDERSNIVCGKRYLRTGVIVDHVTGNHLLAFLDCLQLHIQLEVS